MSGGPLTSLPVLSVDTDLTLSYWNTYVQQNLNYLITAGADLASSTSIIPTNEFHGVTGTTTIDNLSPASPVAGQTVRLWIKAGPLTIRNNGGGTGNIRTAGGQDLVVLPNEIVSFVYDGTVWRQQVQIPLGYVFNRTTFTAPVNITATTEAAANTIVTAGAVVFDGNTPVKISFHSYWGQMNTAGTIIYYLYDGSASIGLIGRQGADAPIHLEHYLTPAAATKTYSIRAAVNTGTGIVNAGAGGLSNGTPGFIKIERA